MSVQSDEPDDATVECDKCSYEWQYSGEMWSATCPRCGYKTSTGLGPDDL